MKKIIAPLFISGALFVSGCSLKPLDNHSVRISLPANLKQQLIQREKLSSKKLGSSTGAKKSLQGPSISNLNCLGINVIGPGIPIESRVGHYDPTQPPPGILAGLVPFDGSTSVELAVDVPSGSARLVQLFAFAGTQGCPTVETLLNSSGSSPQAYGLSDNAMILGQATIDLFQDASVTIAIQYDPNNAQCLFGCHGGSGMPPTLAYLGYFGPMAVPTSLPAPTQVPLSGSTIPIPAATPLSSAQMAPFQNWLPETDLTSPDVKQVMSGSVGFGPRSAIQLLWDVTDLGSYTNGALQLQMRGGAEGSSCPAIPLMDSPFNVSAGIYYPAGGYWIPFNSQGYWDGVVRWQWGGTDHLPLPISQLAFNYNGRNYLVVNVESNFASGDPNCSSVVHVAQAKFQPGGYSDPNRTIWPVHLQALSEQKNNNSIFVQIGTQASLFANGGVPPYTYSLSGAISFIDSQTGHLTASGSQEQFTVYVSDSQSTPSQDMKTVYVVPAGTPIQAAWSGSTSLTAGTCYPYSLNLFSFGGSTGFAPPGGITFNINANNPSFELPAGLFYTSGATCSSDTSGTMGTNTAGIAPAISNASLYFKPIAAGTSRLNANDVGQHYWTSSKVQVTPGAATTWAFSAPSAVNLNACVPIQIFVGDSVGNFIPNQSTGGNSVLPSASVYGSFYTNLNNCIGNVAIGGSTPVPNNPATQAGATQWYFKGTTTMNNASLYGSGGGFTSLTRGITIRAGDEPTALAFVTLPASFTRNACVPVQIQLQDSAPTPTARAVVMGASAQVWLESDDTYHLNTYSDSGCTLQNNGGLMINPGASTATFYVQFNGSANPSAKMTLRGNMTVSGPFNFQLTPAAAAFTLN